MAFSVEPRADRFEVMPNTSSYALTMALKTVFSVMENQAQQHSASGKYPEPSKEEGQEIIWVEE